MMNKITNILALLIFLTSSINFAQPCISERAKPIKDELNIYFQTNFNGMYEVADIVDIDTLQGELRCFYETIQNPYGMLTNSFVFLTRIPMDYHGETDKNRVGIYKDGNIIWLSDAELPYSDGYIFAIDDINNNGNVEILTRHGRPLESICIMSWDGTSEELLTEVYYDTDIQEMADLFYLFDAEGDGIQEIGNRINKDGSLTWSWNGSQYGMWDDTPHLPQDITIFPANNFIPHVKCSVKKENDKYVYSYSVKNDEISKQRINEFNIAQDGSWEIKSVKSPKNWGRAGNGWNAEILNNGNLIWPGNSLSNFEFIARGLPGISNYSSIADNELYGDWEMSSSELGNLSDRYREENLVWGKTLGSKELLLPFIPTDFLDTIKTYVDSSYSLGWIKTEQTRDKYNRYLNNAKNYLSQNNSSMAKTELQKVLAECNADSSSVLTSEAYALLYFNTEYLIGQMPDSEPGLPVKLIDSQGNLLQGGSLKYYDSGWKDAIDNGNGTFRVNTERTTVSLKMIYAGGSQQINNVPSVDGAEIVVFKTVNTIIHLKDSSGDLLDGGTTKYYASGWKEFGIMEDGIVKKELLPTEYSFRINYGGVNNDKKQIIANDSVVVFQTINTIVQLKDSHGNLLNDGQVKYYASGWKDLGTATNGEATKELLPKEYSFRMTNKNISNDKKQNINDNSVVEFSAILITINVKDGNGNLLENTEVQYYSQGWQTIGNTNSQGVITMELLPKNITFRAKYNSLTEDKKQDTANNSFVEIVIE